jgi:uncharacterized repeat protein (TIGR01451 family)
MENKVVKSSDLLKQVNLLSSFVLLSLLLLFLPTEVRAAGGGGWGPLTITKTHSGNFTQGDIGKTYTITVSNNNPDIDDSGSITVVDTLPAGLTATALSGTGWLCDLGTLTCTRTDVLAVGASFPPITLTVNVANNAPASVVNTVTIPMLSVGGFVVRPPSTANDPTTINASVGGISSVPTMTDWGMIILMVLLGGGAVYYLRRRRLVV